MLRLATSSLLRAAASSATPAAASGTAIRCASTGRVGGRSLLGRAAVSVLQPEPQRRQAPQLGGFGVCAWPQQVQSRGLCSSKAQEKGAEAAGASDEPAAEPAAAAAESEEVEAEEVEEEDEAAVAAARIAELEEEVKASKDQYLRAMAEMENVRTIAKRDVSDFKKYASQSFAKSLLVVADNLSLALGSVPEEKRVEGEADPALLSLYEGVGMTETSLLKALGVNGVEKFGEVGEKFDPHRHEAMFAMQDPTKEPNTIGNVVACGYAFKDRVLRPAQVGTISKPS